MIVGNLCCSRLSLNVLCSGPQLQRELGLFICRWRLFQFVFICDIVKMFRQNLIADEDLDFQRMRVKNTEVSKSFN